LHFALCTKPVMGSLTKFFRHMLNYSNIFLKCDTHRHRYRERERDGKVLYFEVHLNRENWEIKSLLTRFSFFQYKTIKRQKGKVKWDDSTISLSFLIPLRVSFWTFFFSPREICYDTFLHRKWCVFSVRNSWINYAAFNSASHLELLCIYSLLAKEEMVWQS